MGEMFCFQCEQTLNGKGCTRVGICGKNDTVAGLQDLLMLVLKGIGFYGNEALKKGLTINDEVHDFVTYAIFSTLTNVDFDADRFVALIKKAAEVKKEMKMMTGAVKNEPYAASYAATLNKEDMIKESKKVGILAWDVDEDIRSLRELLTYGLKGMAAYAHHAYVLGFKDDKVFNFFYKALAATVDDRLDANDLFNIIMQLGKVNLKCMELLDKANTASYGDPEPTNVLITKKKGPFIIVSGHDLKDLKELLKQTEGKGVNVYTHGEMLPAHAYPELKKYGHLIGNYGGAWQDQQKEFDHLPGCILMTTNCLQRPRQSYSDRIFTTGPVGWPGIRHIDEKDGKKDFKDVIDKAIELGGWTEDEDEKTILVGFGHKATLDHADKIIDAVNKGLIKHFFLIGGCDGAKPGRNYYTEFAEKVPKDSVILTLACGKYRFNKLDFGSIGELPRLLDVGQCNDAYSAVQIALALADAFKCTVNELPLTFVLSWYEQKAVCILITLLSLGIKNIFIGPSLPAFISKNVLNILVEKFNLTPISTVDNDLKKVLG